jgi:hypothetical protein
MGLAWRRQGGQALVQMSMHTSNIPTGTLCLIWLFPTPRCASLVAAAALRPGPSAQKKDQDKYRGNNGHEHHLQGFTFVPAFVETYGYLGKPFMRFLNHRSEAVAYRTVGMSKGSFLASALRELSVALIRSQGHVYRSCAELVARTPGRQLVAGPEVPFLDKLSGSVPL